MKKKGKIILASVGVALIALTGAGCLTSVGCTIAMATKSNKILKLAKENGYDEANAVYVQAEVEKLDEKLENGKIDASEYKNRVKNVANLDADTFFEETELGEDVMEKYTSLKNARDNLDRAARDSIYGTIACYGLTLGATVISKSVRKEEKSNETDTENKEENE